MSRFIPKKVKDVEGPSSFSDASGTPKSLHNLVKMSRLSLHTEDSGGPIVR